MVKFKTAFSFILVIVLFSMIMIYIRGTNNEDIRKNFSQIWTQDYVVQHKDTAYVNSSPQTKQTMVLSEGQGYGMMIEAYRYLASETRFYKMYRYYMDHREKNSQLMSWRQIKKKGKWHNDHNSATDGDIFIAFALLLADQRWHTTYYKNQAVRLMNDILRDEYNPQTGCLTVGNWANSKSDFYHLFRTSDVIPTCFDAFYQASGNKRWLQVKRTMLKRLNQLSHQHKSGLVPDFAWVNSKTAVPVKGKITESHNDGSYAANACRVPMNLAFSKDYLAKNTLKRMLKFFSKQQTVLAGYTLKGHPLNDFQSATFSAPIYVAVNNHRNKGFDNLFMSQQYVLTKRVPNNNYYDAVLTTLAAILTRNGQLSDRA